jgi:methylmalonyl-CoA/ethylmalonyl-CoA epimerase
MFKFVHHVHYVVSDRDAMVAYLDKNFGMKPERLEDHADRGLKEALYQVGPTLIEFTQPTDPNSGIGQHLAQYGPGVYHVSWGVDNIRQVARDLMARGNKLRGQGGVTQSARGYHSINIELADSLGIWFQLSEGQVQGQGGGQRRRPG